MYLRKWRVRRASWVVVRSLTLGLLSGLLNNPKFAGEWHWKAQTGLTDEGSADCPCDVPAAEILSFFIFSADGNEVFGAEVHQATAFAELCERSGSKTPIAVQIWMDKVILDLHVCVSSPFITKLTVAFQFKAFNRREGSMHPVRMRILNLGASKRFCNEASIVIGYIPGATMLDRLIHTPCFW